MSVNKAILVGRLGRDPELRYTQNGTPTASWSMAMSRRYKNRDGNYEETTQWLNVKVFGKLAETCDKYLSKGRQVYVEGRIEVREYEGKDGGTRYWTEVVANNVRFLGSRGENSAQRESEAPPPDTQKPNYDEASIPF